MNCFTICSKNFLAYALTLQDSLLTHNHLTTFSVALCDDLAGLDRRSFPFEIISLDQLGIPNLDGMRSRYNITELNTAIKPFVFSHLFDQHPGEVITYFDPDILVLGPLEELQACFDRGAGCVLTPHILEPAEFAEMDDNKFLVYGIYNLGFCAIRDTPQTRRIVSWWGRRLESHCIIDLANGLFVDQKWADLLPAFIDHTIVLRHPGYNVAYWNLSQRRVKLKGGQWVVNGQPLRFFHFSGNKIEDPKIFSRHSTQFTVENIRDVGDLLDGYRRTMYRHGHDYFSRQRYGFSWLGASGRNEHTPPPAEENLSGPGEKRPYLPLLRAECLSDFNTARENLKDVIDARQRAEIDAIPFGEETFSLTGTCACCGRDSSFVVSGMYSSRTLQDGRAFPNWREHLSCRTCGLVNRVRAAFQVLEQEYSPRPETDIYMTERITRNFEWLRARYPNTTGSEYCAGSHKSGDLVDGVLHQDVQSLSFSDKSFDYVLTFDLLEHVPDHVKALGEFFRCLRAGGVLLVTVPFRWASQEHQVRAELSSHGEIRHHLEPEYCGNPLNMEDGSLCFRYFGWQLLDELRAVGFFDARVLNYWSAELMYLGDPQMVVAARKPLSE